MVMELMIVIQSIELKKAFVIEEVSRAGFYFDDDSDLLENPDDPLDQMVFEKDIRDRTSRFIVYFQERSIGLLFSQPLVVTIF